MKRRTEEEIIACWKEKTKPLVSICCTTYNHSKYIRDALDSFLMQITNFPFEIIIFDDASTDGAQTIIKEYIYQYPRLFVPFLQNENLWLNKGISGTFTISFPNAKGKYIAWCEGDDYWTDPYKLQKQVDFLESNPEYVLSATRFKIYDQENDKYFDDWGAKLFEFQDDGIDIKLDKFFNPWLPLTLTTVFRKSSFDISYYKRYKYFRDVHVFLHILLKGKGFVHNFFGGIYRIHENGYWSKKNSLDKVIERFKLLEELYSINKNLDFVKKEYLECFSQMLIIMIKNKKLSYNEIITNIKNYFKQSQSLNKTSYLIIKLAYHKLKCLIP